jgi:exonuclease SbcD
MPTILHFADAHIDISTSGRHDPVTGLPIRVLDFLKALDAIVETAIQEKVDLVLFAGDAYKDRSPSPTFQREWDRRIIQLSAAGIPVLLLVGNHDLSPAIGRASALQEFDTLQVPHVVVCAKPRFLKPEDLENLPLQILALPWITRSSLSAALQETRSDADINMEVQERLVELVQNWLDRADPSIPTILTAHASVEGAVFGGERSVMLGGDIMLPAGLVKDPRLDYVALGHIHKHQDLNPDKHPPVVYPGSIERVDFGEAGDEKGFVLAQVGRGKTSWEWRRLPGRKFIDRAVTITDSDNFMEVALSALPHTEALNDAIVRLVLTYPRQYEAMLDETLLRRQAETAFEFHLVRRPQTEARLRLMGDQLVSSLTPLDLLDQYWKIINTPKKDTELLQKTAAEIISLGEGTNL